jgi:hypothetical protein
VGCAQRSPSSAPVGTLALVQNEAPIKGLVEVKMPQHDGLWYVRCVKQGSLQPPVPMVNGFPSVGLATAVLGTAGPAQWYGQSSRLCNRGTE